MRRRQVWAALGENVSPGSMMTDIVERPDYPPGDDALPEPKRKAGWPKGRKRK